MASYFRAETPSQLIFPAVLQYLMSGEPYASAGAPEPHGWQGEAAGQSLAEASVCCEQQAPVLPEQLEALRTQAISSGQINV